MEKLSGFFKKYQRFLKSDKEAKELVLDVLKDFSIIISEKSVRIKNGVLHFEVNSVLKNELFIRKKDILDSINSKQEQYRFFDIKF